MNLEIPFLNIHSHQERRQGEWNVYSLDATDLSKSIAEHKFLSCGIHPWFITPRWKEDFENLKALWQQPQTLFVGECGLDPNSSHPISLQEEVFRMQAEWAVFRNMPMILHCVKAFDPIIALHKQLRPRAPWVIHGFRGKPQQLQSLLHLGFYVSFGKLFNPESVAVCPSGRFFIETDDSNEPIASIYQHIAQIRSTDVESLKKEQAENLKQLLKFKDQQPNP